MYFGTGCVKTGISDFHKLTYSILRKRFSKGKAKTVFYCDFSSFDQWNF